MKKLQKKKGFTLTELAIVIAVIAILIAVLVPTFVSLINSANDSVDKQTAKNLNTALSVDEAENGKPAALCGVWAVLEEYGYNPAPDPNYSANTFYWYIAENRIVVVSENKVTFPEEYEGIEIVESSASVGVALAATTTATQLTDYSDVYYLGLDENSAYAHAGSFSSYGDECSVCHKKYSTTESFATVLSTLSATNPITLVDDLIYDENSTIAGNYAYVNITSGGTLDLGGNTISISNPSPTYKNGRGIYTNATITLQNGTITMDKTHTTSSYGVIYSYLGDVKILNSTVKLTESGYCLSTATQSSGNISKFTITDSTIIHENADIASTQSPTNVTINVGSAAEVTINGNSKVVGLINVMNGTSSLKSNLTIENGDFTECQIRVASTNTTVTISGGDFTGNCAFCLSIDNSTTTPFTLSGGTFSSACYETIKDRCTFADGYGWSEQNSDGTYSVVVVDTSAT